MIPPGSGEGVPADEVDAHAIWSMAREFKAPDVLPETMFVSIPSAWQDSMPHPETGTMLRYCWENPAAWTTLGADVDRLWFMEQVATRTQDV